MKDIRCFLLVIALSSLVSIPAQAADLYRQRLPLTIPMTPNDRLFVSYDFSEKTGIRCSSNHKNVRIDFTYKGKQKSALLPLVLQSDHVPDKKDEALADVNGRFMLYVEDDASQAGEFGVNCNYVERK